VNILIKQVSIQARQINSAIPAGRTVLSSVPAFFVKPLASPQQTKSGAPVKKFPFPRKKKLSSALAMASFLQRNWLQSQTTTATGAN
jgi:hypothetical protein